MKAWICLFICFIPKAVHLEIAMLLSSDEMVRIIRCLSARRGTPREIWSNQATNFQGVAQKLRSAAIANKASIVWKFIPAYTPHLGGLWESNIKTMKRVLAEGYPSSRLDLPGLHCALCEVERIMNNRPLYLNSETAKTKEEITQAHFLNQNLISALPLELDSPKTLLQHWKQVKQFTESVWVRWREEYLSSPVTQQRCMSPTVQISQGDVVLVKEGQHPRDALPLAKVLEIISSGAEI
jgi:Family of unknown function (DUF5641)